jgi:endosialidase-like protein
VDDIGTIVVSDAGGVSCNHDYHGISIFRGADSVNLNSPSANSLDLSGSANPALRIFGAAGGVRYQAVGTTGPDGFSNVIAFGWDGSLKARVDSVVIGTVTITSDARVKLDVQEDVPGLETVLALRPISFEYDQSKRLIGFEPGRHYGLIAQELEPHLPLLLREEVWDAGIPDESYFTLQHMELIPVLIQAIKDLTERVAAVEAKA